MVHLFEMKGKKIAFDSECSSIYVLDDLSYNLLERYRRKGGERPSETELLLFSRETETDPGEITEICDSFDGLISAQSLFAPRIEADYSTLYPDGPIIKAMCLHICHDCNMRCLYCFAGTGDYGTHNRSMLSAETGRKAVDFLVAASGERHHLDIDFFGGEPLMNWPVVTELTDYCERIGRRSGKDIRITIDRKSVV